MKKTIAILTTVAMLIGCKPFDPKFLNSEGTPFNPKLPAMEKFVENNLVVIVNQSGQAIGANPQDVITVFDREVTEIMTDPYSDKKGIIVLKVNSIENRTNMLGYILGAFIAEVPLLFGAPVATYKSRVEVQIDVMDSNRKLIGSYRGDGYEKLTTGLYRKRNYRQADRVTYLFAVKKAIQDAKTKMTPDLNRLIDALRK